MMHRRTLLLAGAALLGVAPVSLLAAKDHDRDKADQAAARAALARGEILPLARILAIAAGRVPGDVVEVELERKSFGFQYEVKVLTETGRVREVELNARTGMVLSIEDE